jgi:nitroreductase
MDSLEAIHTRRSIRKYTNDPVSDDTVHELLAAAMSAPSAGNEQPWQFIVVKDRTLLSEVARVNPFAGMAKEAPVAVLVCGDTSLEKYPGFWVQDCSAATQNLLLAAHSKGLGAVWTGIHPNQDRVAGFRRLFKLPDPVIPLALVVIGHPAQSVSRQDRYRKERVHINQW